MVDLKVWRDIYDSVQTLGKYLKDSRPDKDGNPPAYTITLKERNSIEIKIKDLISRSNAFLDKRDIKPNPQKWHYDSEDETTWASSEKFAYAHLI